MNGWVELWSSKFSGSGWLVEGTHMDDKPVLYIQVQSSIKDDNYGGLVQVSVEYIGWKDTIDKLEASPVYRGIELGSEVLFLCLFSGLSSIPIFTSIVLS